MIRVFTNGMRIKRGQEYLIKSTWIEIESPIKEDGTVYKQHKNLHLLKLDENNKQYKYYLPEMVDSMYVPDTAKLQIVAKATTLSDASDDYEKSVAAMTKGVPQSEKDTWTKQEAEARGYLVDPLSATPFIDSLSTARGITKEYLVPKIIEKADAYAVALGTLTGVRQKVEDETV